MAAIVWVDVVSFAPDVTDVPIAAQTDILNYVNEYFDVESFGGESGFSLRLCRIFLAAHLGVSALPSTSGATPGPVTSESGGRLSVSYASMVTSTNSLSSTEYGRRLDEIVRTSPARAWVVL